MCLATCPYSLWICTHIQSVTSYSHSAVYPIQSPPYSHLAIIPGAHNPRMVMGSWLYSPGTGRAAIQPVPTVGWCQSPIPHWGDGWHSRRIESVLVFDSGSREKRGTVGWDMWELGEVEMWLEGDMHGHGACRIISYLLLKPLLVPFVHPELNLWRNVHFESA